MEVTSLIKQLRKSKRITQEKLAERLGVSPEYISHIETGRSKPSWKLLIGIARELGYPALELLRRAGFLDSTQAQEEEIRAILATHPEFADIFAWASQYPDIIPDLVRFARFLVSEKEKERGEPSAEVVATH